MENKIKDANYYYWQYFACMAIYRDTKVEKFKSDAEEALEMYKQLSNH